jgi:hypothetical protein
LRETWLARRGTLHPQQLMAGAPAKGDAVRTRGCLHGPQRAVVARVALVVGHVLRVLLLDQRAAAREHLQDAADELTRFR